MPTRKPAGVTVVSCDRTAKPVNGPYTFCYINSLQTQSNELAWWRDGTPTRRRSSGTGAT